MTIEKQRERLYFAILAMLALMLVLNALGPQKNYGPDGDDRSTDVSCTGARC